MKPLWWAVRRFLKKLKTELPHAPAVPLLGIYPEKNMIWKDTCTPVFTAALFTTAKTWKQPKCPSRGTDTDVVYVCNTLLLSHKRSGILPFATIWMDLEGIMVAEMSDRERQILYIFTYLWNIKNKTNKYNKIKKRKYMLVIHSKPKLNYIL